MAEGKYTEDAPNVALITAEFHERCRIMMLAGHPPVDVTVALVDEVASMVGSFCSPEALDHILYQLNERIADGARKLLRERQLLRGEVVGHG